MRIAVAGGTGTVGKRVVDATRAAGHEPVVLSRQAGVDLTTGAGLPGALEGVDAVIDVTSTPSLRSAAAVEFFETVTRTLLEAERAACVPHHVALSIIGAAAVDDGYYAGKAAQERAVAASPDGWSVLRTPQFHEFAQQTLARGTVAGLVLAPRLRSQPVAAAEVAAELTRIAVGSPLGFAPDLAGPREESMPDLVRRLARATGRRNAVLGVPLPSRMGRAMRSGALLAPAHARRTRQTFDQWLVELVRPPGTPS